MEPTCAVQIPHELKQSRLLVGARSGIYLIGDRGVDVAHRDVGAT